MPHDMTIRDVRLTLLRIPWPDSPWMQGHAFGPHRNILVLEVETAGGIVVYWLEEPVPADDFAGYRRVAAALDLRVVGGETHFTRFDLRPFFEQTGVPILQPDPMRGGFTDLRKTAAIADTWGITIAPHLFPELNVQLLASIPNGLWIEEMGLSNDLWIDPVPVIDGMITAPERPGHGLAFKPEVLRDFRTA
jgi:L-alanine-DL-glutamate epimerase-like enolase superfamily enzyme